MNVGVLLEKINGYILLITIFCSIHFDLSERRIPNFLTFPVILWGLISASIFSGFDGAIFSGSGFIVGLAVFFIPFTIGAIGAGDVKLMAAIGALMGYKFVLNTAVITAIIGGIIVLINSLINGTLYRILKNILMTILKGGLLLLYKMFNSMNLYNKYMSIKIELDNQDKKYIPYAIAIGVGAIFVFSRQFEWIMPF